MDEKHRQYCIKLGNPYMREERYEAQFKTAEDNSSWIEENKLQEDNYVKNNKKFTSWT